jgi:hypothetical protein
MTDAAVHEAIERIEHLRRTSVATAVLLCAPLLSQAAHADRNGDWAGVSGFADVAMAPAASQVPRFSSAAWIEVGTEQVFRSVVADLNRDGKHDIAVVDWGAATMSVMLGDGTGQFGRHTAYRTGRRPYTLAAGDLNGDGGLDLVTASEGTTKSINVFINRGAGHFRRARAISAGRDADGIATADVNGDGILDLLSAHANRRHLTVSLGAGAGAFRVAHRYRGGIASDLAVGDLNRDGAHDVVIADTSHSAVAVRLGRGDGSFGEATAYRSGTTPYSIAVADLNHDGHLDITAANYRDANVAVLLGAGDGSFGPRTRYPMGDPDEDFVDTVVVADYDRDGHLDIATPGPYLRRGRGDGTFDRKERAFTGFAYTNAGAVGDFNGDGWPDLVFSEACDEIEGGCEYWGAKSIVVMLNWTGDPVPPCVVPSIIGGSERQATRWLRLAGCRVGQIRHRRSRQGRKGTVIRQRPESAAVRPNDSPVNIVISSGGRR